MPFLWLQWIGESCHTKGIASSASGATGAHVWARKLNGAKKTTQFDFLISNYRDPRYKKKTKQHHMLFIVIILVGPDR